MSIRAECLGTLVYQIILQIVFKQEVLCKFFFQAARVVAKPNAAVFGNSFAIRSKYFKHRFEHLLLTVSVEALFAIVTVVVDVNCYTC